MVNAFLATVTLLLAGAFSFLGGRLWSKGSSFTAHVLLEFLLRERIDVCRRLADKFDFHAVCDVTEWNTHATITKKYNRTLDSKHSVSREELMEQHYEMLVHPAMLAHEDVMRVAIISSGNGEDSVQLAKQVLKHEFLEEVLMFSKPTSAGCASAEKLQQSINLDCDTDNCDYGHRVSKNRSLSSCT